MMTLFTHPGVAQTPSCTPLYRQQSRMARRVSRVESGSTRARRGAVAVRAAGSLGERGPERKSVTPSVTTGAAVFADAPPGRVRREKKTVQVLSETGLVTMMDQLHIKPSVEGAQVESGRGKRGVGLGVVSEVGGTDDDAMREQRIPGGSADELDSSSTSRWAGAEQIAAPVSTKRSKVATVKPKRVPWNKGLKHSEETKAKIRATTREAMKRPDIIAKLTISGHKQRHTAETKAKISAKIIERYAKATREKEAKMEALHGPQWREVEEAEKAEAKEVKLAVQRAKRAVVRAAKEVVKDAERKEKAKIRPSREYKSPEHRAKISQAIRAKWQDSSYRSRVCENMKNVVRARPSRPRVYKPKARKTELTAEQQAERDRKETLAAHIKMKEQLRNRASMMLADAERAARTLEQKADTTGVDADRQAAVTARQSLEAARTALQGAMGDMVPGGASVDDDDGDEEDESDDEEWDSEDEDEEEEQEEQEEEEEEEEEQAQELFVARRNPRSRSPSPPLSNSNLAKARGIIMPGGGRN